MNNPIPNENADTAPQNNPHNGLTESNVLKLILERIDVLEKFCGARFTDLEKEIQLVKTDLDKEIQLVKKELRSINNRLAAFAEENNRIQGELVDHRKRLSELEEKVA